MLIPIYIPFLRGVIGMLQDGLQHFWGCGPAWGRGSGAAQETANGGESVGDVSKLWAWCSI